MFNVPQVIGRRGSYLAAISLKATDGRCDSEDEHPFGGNNRMMRKQSSCNNGRTSGQLEFSCQSRYGGINALPSHRSLQISQRLPEPALRLMIYVSLQYSRVGVSVLNRGAADPAPFARPVLNPPAALTVPWS